MSDSLRAMRNALAARQGHPAARDAARSPELPASTRGRPARLSLALLVLLGASALGCSELQARRHARAGNSLYHDGDYAGAVREYEQAQQYYDQLPVVAMNKGLACRQLMIPGSKTAENERAVDCALDAFTKLKQLNPEDPRGDQLYVQTLFDADRFDALAKMYEGQLEKNPKSLAAVNGLITVHSRANHWREALEWTKRRAELESDNAESQYAVGVLIHNLLFQRGGSDKGAFDPRPDPNADKRTEVKIAPQFAPEDIAGEDRIKLADDGIAFLQKAIELRPGYKDAMVFVNLLYRQKSFAYFDQPEEWFKLVEEAEVWRNKSLEAMKAEAAKAAAAAPAEGQAAAEGQAPSEGQATPEGESAEGAAPTDEPATNE